MLRVAVNELIAEVRVTLDENASQSAYIQANRDNLELDEIIRAKLVEAARDITETGSVDSLEPEPMTTVVSANGHGGTLSVPEDFLRLVSLKMEGWDRSVTVVAGEGSDIELMQRNPYTRGTGTKPVCAYSRDANGNKVIEYFGASDKVEKVLYMPIPNYEMSGGTEVLGISRLLRQAIVRRTAGLVLLSRGETELAAQFLS